jgi:hypothetical protein
MLISYATQPPRHDHPECTPHALLNSALRAEEATPRAKEADIVTPPCHPQVGPTDMNCLAVINYAVEQLKVRKWEGMLGPARDATPDVPRSLKASSDGVSARSHSKHRDRILTEPTNNSNARMGALGVLCDLGTS